MYPLELSKCVQVNPDVTVNKKRISDYSLLRHRKLKKGIIFVATLRPVKIYFLVRIRKGALLLLKLKRNVFGPLIQIKTRL